ncbi:SPOR domain-containing protein [Bdellovibrionota bacterium FG-1]
MEQNQRFFIYDRKEMGVLLLLGVMVAIFAFTLGVHLGKRIGPKGMILGMGDAETIATLADKVPGRQDLNEQAKGAQQAAEESLNQALHDEVARTGIKLDNPKQIALPDKTRSENGGATTGAEGIKVPEPAVSAAAVPTAVPSPAASAASIAVPSATPSLVVEHAAVAHGVDVAAPVASIHAGKFSLQIGSYQTQDEANDQSQSLAALGIKPIVKTAEVKGKSWFRIYVGRYDTHEAAEKAGQRFVSQHMIEAYVITKWVD